MGIVYNIKVALKACKNKYSINVVEKLEQTFKEETTLFALTLIKQALDGSSMEIANEAIKASWKINHKIKDGCIQL